MKFCIKKTLSNDTIIVGVSSIIYIIAAINLDGYFHPDEHYQILEFANYKLGKIDAGQMPWEFNYEMRSSFQPWIAYLAIKFFNLFQVCNPFIIALALRLMTGCFSIYAISKFIRTTSNQLDEKFKVPYKWLSFIIWFLPYLSIRFSSEIWSGLFFLLAVCYLIPDINRGFKYSVIGGIFFGLSYLCRFQSAIMIIGLVLWLLIIQKRKFKQIIILSLSIFLIIIFGVYIDYLYYGDWTLTVWNYFNMNIVNDMASDFGVMSAYSFMVAAINQALFPFGILILFCLVVLIIRAPKSFVVWCVAPLLVIHLIVPHKEVRFLFPIIYFIPFIIFKAASLIANHFQRNIIKDNRWLTKSIDFIYLLPITINIIYLVVALFSPPIHGRMAIAKYIYNHYPNEQIQLLSFKQNNPFKPYSVLRQSFYEMKNLDYVSINHYDTLPQIKIIPFSTIKLLVIRRNDFTDSTISNLIHQSKITIVKTANPLWIDKIRDLVGINNSEYILCKYK
ncbi:hypothetical protein A9P82_08765 [Arachidicoccus ginsenosidimutans]|uniref:hypothetical protein n=1 Tax=Arachidicoccus sp. BS20 TaxID=1850526 RepID=UPI0007F135A3|nr:hypothetical protein [Arachidicoccus sp. BS20]ANI89374.1 hypothetical protein A9P82_08765 [Arachidicoccus sp. BS20]